MVGLGPSSKQVLLFGSRGQLGSRIKDNLESQGIQVLEPIYLAGENASLAYREVDVKRTLAQGLVSTIINAASPNAAFADSNPTLVQDWASRRGSELVRLCESVPASQLVHLSTVQVYGEDLSGVISESSPLLGARPYALMHKALEARLEKIEQVAIFRLGNVFGRPGNSGVISWTLVTHELARKFAIDQVAHIRSNPSQTRDFVPTSAVVKSLDRVLGAKNFGVYNLTSGQSRTLRAWAGLIRDRAEIVLNQECELFFDGEDHPTREVKFQNGKIRQAELLTSIPVDQEIQELDDLIRFAKFEGLKVNV